MIKALSAIAIAAFIAAALTILPGFAPQVEASVPVALAKGDRLDIRPIGRDCSQQAWPQFRSLLPAQRRHQDRHHPRSSAGDHRAAVTVSPSLPRAFLQARSKASGVPTGGLFDSKAAP